MEIQSGCNASSEQDSWGHDLQCQKLVLRTLLTKDTVSSCLVLAESSDEQRRLTLHAAVFRKEVDNRVYCIGIPTTQGYPRAGMRVLAAGSVCASTAASTITPLYTSEIAGHDVSDEPGLAGGASVVVIPAELAVVSGSGNCGEKLGLPGTKRDVRTRRERPFLLCGADRRKLVHASCDD
jgi:hypothetical protein